MFWTYTRSDTKLLLLSTLLLFAGCAFMLAQDMRIAQIEMYGGGLAAQTIGVYAGVQENEVNKLAMELNTWQQDLEAREHALASAERAPKTDPYTLALVAMIGAGLLGLILTNFYLDHKRRIVLAS